MGGARRGFKVTDADRKVRVGIAVETYDDLRRKTVEKFKSPLTPAEIVFQMRDGQPVACEQDFVKLPAQSLLIWTRIGDKADTDAEILYRTIREVNVDFLSTGEKVQEFFTEQMKDKVFKLADVLKGIDDDHAKLSTKEEDPEWFKGVESRAKTKEEYMFRRAQDRVRTYFYKTKDELLSRTRTGSSPVSASDVERLRHLNRLVEELQARLKAVQFFGCYFDRRKATSKHSKNNVNGVVDSTKLNAICDKDGNFQCQGAWNLAVCPYEIRHQINPYQSREARIVFQTWNLDHNLERSRSIIPAIMAVFDRDETDAKKAKIAAICPSLDFEQIFVDLFTLSNLKLVHVVCHDKGAHASPDLDRYVKCLT